MQSPRYVAKYGAIRFLSCPGRAGIVSKFRAVSGTACKMPSPTPPKSAKVELSYNKCKCQARSDIDQEAAVRFTSIRHITHIRRAPPTDSPEEAILLSADSRVRVPTCASRIRQSSDGPEIFRRGCA